jgi:hypothetical protein
MKPHKHAELIKAWADGAQIQYWNGCIEQWKDGDREEMSWYEDYQYRIKPEPKPDVVATFYFLCDLEHQHVAGMKADLEDSNVKLVFDGETGELKSAEVLK